MNTTTKFTVGDKVVHAGERAIIVNLGEDARGAQMATIRKTDRRSQPVYLSELVLGNW